MMNTKRGLRAALVFLCVALALGMCGCKSNNADKETGYPEEAEVIGQASEGEKTGLDNIVGEAGSVDSFVTGAESENNNSEAESENNNSDAGICSLPDITGELSVAVPVFSVKSGCYDVPFILNIEVPAGFNCYYTTDGSNPLSTRQGYKYFPDRGISVTDRTGEPNVVNAVPTELYDAANVKVSTDRKSFTTTSRNPGDEAIDKCTVIRAVLVGEDGTAGQVMTATYFVGDLEQHIPGAASSAETSAKAGMGSSLAVISIAGDYEDFFEYDTGIYVKGRLYDEAIAELLAAGQRLDADTSRRIAANYNQKGRDWEREVHIDFFEADADGLRPVLNQNCGIRIQGNYSRSDLQKGFRLYARAEYGAKNFKYPVFGEDVKDPEGNELTKYKSLILRNGGNCAFTTKWSADYWAYLARGLKCETMASRPAVVYLNGEYWGLYVLEENYSKDYFADKRGVDKDSVVLYKGDSESLELGYKLDLGELPENVTAEDFYFRSLTEFFRTHDSLEADEDYASFCKIVDPESVRDYFAVETWINNKWDWPGKNWSMWKVASRGEQHGIAGAMVEDDTDNKYADGRWRFCFYDLEFGGVSGAGDANVNTIKEDNYKTYGLLDMNTDNPAVLCFAYCMTNEGFRQDFYAKLRELNKVIFMKARAQSVLNSFAEIYQPLYDSFFKAFPGTGSTQNSINGGYASKKCISDFLDKRYDYIEKMIEWCEKHYQ